MRKQIVPRLRIALLGAIAALTYGASAHATAYTVSVSEGLQNGNGFAATNVNPFAGANTASATFTYTGALNFSNTAGNNSGPSGDLNSAFGFSAANISAYTGSGTVLQNTTPVADFTTVTSFLGSSGSASNYQYGSYYAIDLGVLAAGTILTITHDDGASVYQGSTRLGNTTAGATAQVTEAVKIATTADTTLYYGRENGTPSVLNVAVPEPMSLGLLATGLIGLGISRRRKRA